MTQTVKVTKAPAIPETLYERSREHLRVGASPADNDTLTGLVQAAIGDFERHTSTHVFNRDLTAYLSGWPSGRKVDLGVSPLNSVVAVKYTDADGASQTVASSNYYVDTVSEVGSIAFKSTFDWPELELENPHPVQIEFKSGFGESLPEIPELITAGILLYAGHLYDNRDAKSVRDLEHIKDVLFNRYRQNFLGA